MYVMMTFRKIMTFTICGWIFLSVTTAHPLFSGGWKLESEKNGIKIFTRLVKGSQLKQVKGVVHVHASLDDVLNILTDYKNYTKWVNNITESYIIKAQSDSVHYVYTFEDAPWPVQNRYHVSKMTLRRTKTRCELTFQAVPDFIEKRFDAIQIERYQGSWKLSAMPGGGCHIEYILDENPGGYIPPWLVNYMAVTAPLKTIENLKIRAERLSKS